MISALRYGAIASGIEMFKALQKCPTNVRAANLRAVMNSGSAKDVLLRQGHQISEWISEKTTGPESNMFLVWHFTQFLTDVAKIVAICGD